MTKNELEEILQDTEKCNKNLLKERAVLQLENKQLKKQLQMCENKVKEYLEKAKNRVIHEFEYQNGKYIQHYVLGGEHELKPQDIVDCLNALATMYCDLQTAYAYIKGQDKKNKDLKEQLAIREKALKNSCIKVAELDFIFNGIIHNDKYWKDKFIKQAKEFCASMFYSV